MPTRKAMQRGTPQSDDRRSEWRDEWIVALADRELEKLTAAGHEGFSPYGMELRVTLVACADALRAHLEAHLANWGLNASMFRVLMSLRHSDSGSRSMGQIAKFMSTHPRNVTPIVDALHALHLVRRRFSREDRRVTFVELTPKGERLLNDLLPESFAMLDEIIADLSQEEALGLIEALDKIRRRLADASAAADLPAVRTGVTRGL